MTFTYVNDIFEILFSCLRNFIEIFRIFDRNFYRKYGEKQRDIEQKKAGLCRTFGYA